MSEAWRSWKSKMVEWRRRWPKATPAKGDYDPTAIRVLAATCAKKGCGSRNRVQRHHIGNDYLFACIAEDWFAERYIQFHPDDCVPLCKRCHKKIHVLYQPLLGDFWLFYKATWSKADLERWRASFAEICVKWIAKPKRSRRAKHKRGSQGHRVSR